MHPGRTSVSRFQVKGVVQSEKRVDASSQLSMTLFWLPHGGGIRGGRRQHLGKAATNIRRSWHHSQGNRTVSSSYLETRKGMWVDTVLLEQKKRNLEGGDDYCSGQNRL